MARRKTPQQIERQYANLVMRNYLNPNGENRQRTQRLIKAVKNVREQNFYRTTGTRTRNMDEIFINTVTGRPFTVQGDKIVTYKGNRVSRQAFSVS